MDSQLLTVDQVITEVSESTAHNLVRDYALSMVFANASARAQSKASASSDYSVFKDMWLSQLGKLGWVISNAGTTNIQSSSSDKTNIAALIRQQATSQSVANILTLLDKSFSAPKDSNDRPAVRPSQRMISTISNWWDFCVNDAGVMHSVIGLVGSQNDRPIFELDIITIDLSKVEIRSKGLFSKKQDFSYEDVSCLFDDIDPDTVDISCQNLTAQLDPSVFNGVRDELAEKLGDKFADHYAAFPNMNLRR